MDAAFKDPEPPSYTEAQSCPSVQPIIELKPDSEWTSPPLITATAPPMPIAPSMPTTLPMPTVPPLSPAPPMAPGQIPVDLNMLVTPEQLDVLFHVARQQISMLQRQQQQQLQEEAMGTSMGTILHLIIVIIITVICALFNITSLISVGIPAIICSSMAYRNKKKEKYATAKKLGYMAYFLSLFNIIFTAVFAIMAIIATSFSFMS